MKVFYYLGILLLLAGCHNNSADIKQLEDRVDSLENKLDDSYKPGLGEFMSGIQVHHAKLWFAGINNNWELARFELNEISEALEDINKYEQDRKELSSLPIIYPPLDSMSKAVAQADVGQFKKSFILLTNTCNNCHRAVNYSFNEVKIPETPPFSNQEFEKKPH